MIHSLDLHCQVLIVVFFSFSSGWQKQRADVMEKPSFIDVVIAMLSKAAVQCDMP